MRDILIKSSRGPTLPGSPDTLARRPDAVWRPAGSPVAFDGLTGWGPQVLPRPSRTQSRCPEHVLGIQKGLIYAHRANAGDVWKYYAIGSLGAVYQCGYVERIGQWLLAWVDRPPSRRAQPWSWRSGRATSGLGRPMALNGYSATWRSMAFGWASAVSNVSGRSLGLHTHAISTKRPDFNLHRLGQVIRL